MIPNPFGEMLTLDYQTEYSGTINISLIDLTGRVFYRESVEGAAGRYNKMLSTRNLASGMYLLRIQQGEKVLVKRVVKN
ncbi:MAG: T9SS type A sorting domain-containing protein [Bacteroidia bacterium]